MRNRFSLMNGGLFPETLPPCFDSQDAKRAFHGIVGDLDDKQFHSRTAQFIRYSGTKHNGSRRFFGTPNIVPYFHVSSFIHRNWGTFEGQFAKSDFSIGAPVVLSEDDDRAVKVPSLSELSFKASKKIGYAPIILKTDIAQFFPSIYTHSLSWAAHGRQAAKADTRATSPQLPFNALDKFICGCQSGQTRGVIVGPDAFRLVAEFISSEIDCQLKDAVSEIGVGAVRHVDDYYFGLKTETDALVLLSRFREILANYELQVNDSKTEILSSLEPINDLWAQRIRGHLRRLMPGGSLSDLELTLNEVLASAREVASDSPIKMFLRRLDELKIYRLSTHWEFIEPYLQRIAQSHPHAVDYVCLLVAKRVAIDQLVDTDGWLNVALTIFDKGLALNNHHEVVWMLRLMLTCEIDLDATALEALDKSSNDHVKALLVQAFVEGRTDRKPRLTTPARLLTADDRWLSNLVAKSQEFSRSKFGGDFAAEFAHLADRHIKLVDLEKPIKAFQTRGQSAISRSRYGYDDNDEEDDDFWDHDIHSLDALDSIFGPTD